jgi:hypothetical protein
MRTRVSHPKVSLTGAGMPSKRFTSLQFKPAHQKMPVLPVFHPPRGALSPWNGTALPSQFHFGGNDMLNPCPLNGFRFIPTLREQPKDKQTHPANDEVPIDEWSEEDIVFLHWRLLHQVFDLSESNTPLDEKIDILRWVFTESDREQAPFSFSICVRVVTLSPLSPIPYCGVTDVEEIRDWLKHHAMTWLQSTIDRYPLWVREAFLNNPHWFVRRLEKNPQWINEQVKKYADQGNLFA